MNSEDIAAIKDALERVRKDEPFEKTLGRVLRRNGRSFDDYLRIIGELREIARKKKMSLYEAGNLLTKGLNEGEYDH
ncbi:MAG: hypothetical protein QW083_03335 [Methanomassiliicoccales archaeon]